MKKKLSPLFYSIIVVLACSNVTTVFAQSTGAKKNPKVTVYNFDEVDILGNVKKPDGVTVKERPETYFKRLLNLDESFIPNIIRSVEDF
ncbi:hypothetical protein MRY82_05655 [bacterium]|nr:hypothetical protein [bacterium]